MCEIKGQRVRCKKASVWEERTLVFGPFYVVAGCHYKASLPPAAHPHKFLKNRWKSCLKSDIIGSRKSGKGDNHETSIKPVRLFC